MEKQTHIAVGLATAATIMLQHELTTQEIVYGSIAALIASTIPDADLIDNRTAGPIAQIWETIKYSEYVIILYLYIQSKKYGSWTYLIKGWDLHLDSRFSIPVYFFQLLIWMGYMHLTVTSPHRGRSHSITWMLIGGYLWNWIFHDSNMLSWFILAYASHLIIDLPNKTGEALFFPVGKPVCFGICQSSGIVNNILGIAAMACYLTQLLKI